ncbi:MAG: dienelactone hydrolase-like enzyme [Planctomycetaceae bacterium]|nr:dienelactone hydrolase-like enzyme [Planctomycetaceae bacterium]
MVKAARLLIVGGNDMPVIQLNQEALKLLGSVTKQLVIVPGATHLFEERGALEHVAELAADWFGQHLFARVYQEM